MTKPRTREPLSWLGAGELTSYAGEATIARLSEAKSRVLLASPFLSDGYARLLCDAVPSLEKGDFRLLVALISSSVENHVLSIPALRRMAASGFQIANVPNLHAKLSLIDDEWGLLGSGNLTKAGQDGTNIELGVALRTTQVHDARGYFESWWERSTPINPNDLKEFAEWKKRLPKREARQAGPKHGVPIRLPKSRPGSKPSADRSETGYWVKAMYDRHAEPGWWHAMDHVNDAPARRKGGPKYSEGDLMVVYLRGPARCPAIVRVVEPPRYDEKESNKGIPQSEWGRWPWITRVEVVESVSIVDALRPDQIGVNPISLQNGRKRLSREMYEVAELWLSSRR